MKINRYDFLVTLAANKTTLLPNETVATNIPATFRFPKRIKVIDGAALLKPDSENSLASLIQTNYKQTALDFSIQSFQQFGKGVVIHLKHEFSQVTVSYLPETILLKKIRDNEWDFSPIAWFQCQSLLETYQANREAIVCKLQPKEAFPSTATFELIGTETSADQAMERINQRSRSISLSSMRYDLSKSVIQWRDEQQLNRYINELIDWYGTLAAFLLIDQIVERLQHISPNGMEWLNQPSFMKWHRAIRFS